MNQPQAKQPPQRIHRSAKQWQILIDQFETSGLSPRAFCQQAGISHGTFSRWRRRLTIVDEQPPRAIPKADLFVELSAEATPPVATPAWDVELQLGRDVFLRLRYQPC